MPIPVCFPPLLANPFQLILPPAEASYARHATLACPSGARIQRRSERRTPEEAWHAPLFRVRLVDRK